MNDSLKEKTVKGVSWSFTDNLVSTGISFVVGIILARLLSPHEFGVLGMIAIFIAVSTSIVDSGFSSALIRKTDARDIDYNTVFFFNLLIGVVFYIILFFSAPAISRFFKEPQLILITRVMGSILIINALAIIQRTLLVKDVDFKTQTKVSVIASLSSGIIGVGMALLGCGVWSLVGQQLSRNLLNSLFLWVYSNWRPAFEFSKKSFDELFEFGSKLLLSGLINTIYSNIYYVVIGHYYSAPQLGQYTRAEQFSTIFSSNLTTVVQRVSYPVLSSIQDDQSRLKSAYRRVIKATMLVTFACMLGLAAIAKPLVLVLIGAKWLQCAYYLQIICFAGMLYPLHATNLNILQVKGRSDLFLKLEIIKKIMGIVPIVLGIFYGIEYMLWGSVSLSFIAYFLNAYYSADLIDYPAASQIKDIMPSLVISASIAFLMWSLTLFGIANWLTLIMQCLMGIVLALVVYEKLKPEEYLEIKHIIYSLIKRA